MDKRTVNLRNYQSLCKRTARKYKSREKEIMTWGLGICGEAGDVAGCIKKTYGQSDDQREGIKENLGDTMWYIAMICNFYGWRIEDILKGNIAKLAARYQGGGFKVKHATRGGTRIDWNEGKLIKCAR